MEKMTDIKPTGISVARKPTLGVQIENALATSGLPLLISRRYLTKMSAIKMQEIKPTYLLLSNKFGKESKMSTIDGIGIFEPGDYGLTEGRDYINVPALGVECRFMLEGYEGDSRPADFRDVMLRFIALSPQVLTDAAKHVYGYYTDVRNSGWGDPPEIPSAERVWDFVDFGTAAIVSRRGNGDDRIYISLECGCAWEREHGLQIVFREGNFIRKVGQFDGHVSNADAFADPSMEDIVYAA